jgi:anti-sigma B factor antagonist
MSELDLKTHTETDGVVVVEVSGEIDISSGRDLERELREVESRGPKILIVDLRGTTFIDSTGLRLLVTAQGRATEASRRMVIVQGPEAVQRIFQITRLDDRLEFVTDPSEITP